VVGAFRHLSNRDLRFGSGRFGELPDLVPDTGTVLFITGRHFQKSPAWSVLVRELKNRNVKILSEIVTQEPSPEVVDSLTETSRNSGVETVVAIGGGSVLDAGKAVAAMLRHEGGVTDYLEGVGHLEPTGATVPLIAVPTTAGTGSEATKNAVISRRGADGFKKSLRHDAFIPGIALIDPELAVGCPPDVSLSCGMDAFCQLLESWVSTGATPMTDALAKDGMAHFAKGSRLFSEGLYGEAEESDCRSHLAMAAYNSGLTLANAGLGSVHGIAGPLGAFCKVPHGVACGLLLAPVFRRIITHLENIGAAEEKVVLSRLTQAGSILGEESLDRMMRRFEVWSDNLPKLSSYGLEASHVDAVIASSSNKNSPVSLSPEEMKQAVMEVY
jgi:alcohol dehydrogenase class IV